MAQDLDHHADKAGPVLAFGTVDQGIVRFSFSYFNTEEEADTAVKAVRSLAQ